MKWKGTWTHTGHSCLKTLRNNLDWARLRTQSTNDLCHSREKALQNKCIVKKKKKKKKVEEEEKRLTGLDGSRIETMRMGSSRRMWLECIFALLVENTVFNQNPSNLLFFLHRERAMKKKKKKVDQREETERCFRMSCFRNMLLCLFLYYYSYFPPLAPFFLLKIQDTLGRK